MGERRQATHWPSSLPTLEVHGAASYGADVAWTGLVHGLPVELVDPDESLLSRSLARIERHAAHADRTQALDRSPQEVLAGLRISREAGASGATERTVVFTPRRELPEPGELRADLVLASELLPPFDGPLACWSAPVVRTRWAELEAAHADERSERAGHLLAALGRERVPVRHEGRLSPGIRIAAALFAAAAESALDPSGLDAGFRQHGAAWGPFERMDGIGLGRVAHILEAADREPPTRLIERIHAARGTGARPAWHARGSEAPVDPVDPAPIVRAAADAAAELVEKGHDAAQVERAARLQAGLARGPLATVASYGDDTPAAQLGLGLAGPGFDVTREGDLTHVRLHGGASGARLTDADAPAFVELVRQAEGPLLITGEGAGLLRPDHLPLPEAVTDPLRRAATVAIVHGHSADGAMSLARACRHRVAVLGASIGASPPVPAHRALELELVDAIAHPLSVADAVASLLDDVATSARIAHLLA